MPQMIQVKELMVPLKEYATVSQDANLLQAVLALVEAHQNWRQDEGYKHRAILVLDDQGNVVGKISQFDAIRALEPKYDKLYTSSMTRSGFSPEFLRDMLQEQQLFQDPLEDVCHTAAKLKVRDFMYTPGNDEIIKESATLAVAMHLLLTGHHQSLLVTDESGKIVGILRLSDVFRFICDKIASCEI